MVMKIFCCLSEVDTIKNVISQFLEMVVDKSFKPSKYYGARIAHKGKVLSLDENIFLIFSKKFDNIVTLLLRKTTKRNNKVPVKSNELSNKKPKTITIDGIEDENNITKSTSKQRLANKLVKQHIVSYVLNVTTDKSADHNELKKLCLNDSKIS